VASSIIFDAIASRQSMLFRPSFFTDYYAVADMNECNIDNGGCDHECCNTIGSYVCKCRPGFQLDTDGRNCIGMYIRLTIYQPTKQ